ncbi:hypothetical protein KKG81_04650 [bacterium]|nr:hypothetical protein [bacterium]
MSNKQYGLTKERLAKKVLEKKGFYAHRCRGSFGGFDILAHNGKEWKLIQCKATKQVKVSYKKTIEELQNVKVPKNTSKELWIWWTSNKDRDKKGWEIIKIK